MNIVFAGTPHFALPCLDALAQSEHQLTAIYTQPDRPAGRGHQLQPSPVKTWAESHDIMVYQPVHFKQPSSLQPLAALKPDVMVVIAYGLILPRAILDIPRYGCINVHASLLPRWRGASPIQHAILHHDTHSGITIMQMDEGLDTGSILAAESCLIGERDTAGILHDQLAQLASGPLLNVLHALANGMSTAAVQENQLATYAPKINKNDAAIDWQQTATSIDCQIRAFNPWPIAYTHAKGETIRIHQAQALQESCNAAPGTILAIQKGGLWVATGQQILRIERLQFAGGKALKVADWLNANHDKLQVGWVLQ